MRERARASRRTSSRHSNVTARGRGDARDHRRENQRITENDLDPAFLEINREGKITLKVGLPLLQAIGEALVGKGLALSTEGKLDVKLAPSLVFDQQARAALRSIGFDETSLTDSSGGTSGGDTIAAVTNVATAANAVATLAAKLNELIALLPNTAPNAKV